MMALPMLVDATKNHTLEQIARIRSTPFKRGIEAYCGALLASFSRAAFKIDDASRLKGE